MTPLIVGQVHYDGVFIDAGEFRRVIVGIAEDWMKECFARALHNDGLASRPANIHSVWWNAVQTCECARDCFAVNICPVRENYFQLASDDA